MCIPTLQSTLYLCMHQCKNLIGQGFFLFVCFVPLTTLSVSFHWGAVLTQYDHLSVTITCCAIHIVSSSLSAPQHIVHAFRLWCVLVNCLSLKKKKKKITVYDIVHLLCNLLYITRTFFLGEKKKVRPKVHAVLHVTNKTRVHSLCQCNCTEKYTTAGVVGNLVLVTQAVCGFLRVKQGWEPMKKWTMPLRV